MDLVKIGPVGGSNGSCWDFKGRDQVAGIFVVFGPNTIYSLQFFFYENGNLINKSDIYGGVGGTSTNSSYCAVVLDYPSEFLTSISSYSGYLVLEAIKFNTNKSSYGPFGGINGKFACEKRNLDFQIVNHYLFGGFHGTKNSYGIESIGIYVKPNVNLKDSPQVKDEKVED